MFNKIIKWCIYLMVFLVPLFWLPITLESFEFNKGYLMFFLVSIGVLVWLGRMIFREKQVKIKTSLLDPFILLFLLIMILSSLLSVDRISSILGFYGRFWPSLVGTLSLGGFYFLVTNNVKTQQKEGETNATLVGIIKSFLFSSFLVIFFSYFSIFGLLSKLSEKWNLPRAMSLTTFNLSGGSLEGLSLFCVFICVLTILLLALRGKGGVLTEKHNAVPFYILLFLSLGVIMIVGFQVAWITLVISLVLFLLFSFWKRVFKENVNKLSLSIFFILIGLIFIFFNPIRNLLPQDTAINNLPAEILLTQKASWSLAWQGLGDHPIVGAGPSNFVYTFAKFKPAGFLQSPFWQLRFDRSGSYLAELLSDTGILGMLSYLLMIGMFLLVSYFFISSFKKESMIAKEDPLISKEEKKILVLPFLLSFISLVVIQLFYYQTTILALSFWLIMALGVVSWGGGSRKERVFSFKDFPELGLLFSIVFWVCLIGIMFAYFTMGKYYVADAMYKKYLISPSDNLSQLKKASQLAPKRTTYHLVLANDYMDRAQEELAKEGPDPQVIADFVASSVDEVKISLAQSPNRVVSHEMAGIVYRGIRGMAQGAEEWAIKSFEKALEFEPSNAVILTELGKLYLKTDVEKARENFLKAVEARTSYFDAQMQLVLLDEQEGNIEASKDRLEELVEISPFSTEARFQLGRIYYNNSDYDNAKQQFEAVLTLFPNHSNSLYSLALVYEKKGMKEEALIALRKVLELNPGVESVQEKIADIEAGNLNIEELVVEEVEELDLGPVPGDSQE